MKTKTNGSGLIFAVILLFVILGMVVTLSSVTVLETKMSQKTKSSVGAFYNSEAGVEWALNKIANSSSGNAAISTLGSCPFTDCSVLFLGADGKVLASAATIDQVKAVRSIGSQGGETQRAIEAAVASSGPRYTSASTSISNGNNATFTHNLGYIPNCLWTSSDERQFVSIRTIDTTQIKLYDWNPVAGGSTNVVVYCW